jgi:molecular chaperone Hsp33
VTAGGFLVQALPGASDQAVRLLEKQILGIESLEKMLMQNADPLHLLSQIFQNNSFVVLEESPLTFQCNCSWERVERALRLVGETELQAMLVQQPPAVVHCDFCAKDYSLDAERIRKLITSEGSFSDD